MAEQLHLSGSRVKLHPCSIAVRAAHLSSCLWSVLDLLLSELGCFKLSHKQCWKPIWVFFFFFRQKDQAGKFGLNITVLLRPHSQSHLLSARQNTEPGGGNRMLEEASMGRNCWDSIREILPVWCDKQNSCAGFLLFHMEWIITACYLSGIFPISFPSFRCISN